MVAESPRLALKKPKARKLTKADVELVADLVARTRCTEREACLKFGIGIKQWTNFKSRKKTSEDFDDVIARLRIEQEDVLIERIRNAGTSGERPDWRANAWILERTRPERYGQAGNQSGQGPSITVNVALVDSACEQIMKLATRTPKQLDGPKVVSDTQSSEGTVKPVG